MLAAFADCEELGIRAKPEVAALLTLNVALTIPARILVATFRRDIPPWIDAALEEAVSLRPADRTEALSAFTANLRRPNTALILARARPLLERNPVLFWKSLALLLFALCVMFAVLASGR